MTCHISIISFFSVREFWSIFHQVQRFLAWYVLFMVIAGAFAQGLLFGVYLQRSRKRLKHCRKISTDHHFRCDLKVRKYLSKIPDAQTQKNLLNLSHLPYISFKLPFFLYINLFSRSHGSSANFHSSFRPFSFLQIPESPWRERRRCGLRFRSSSMRQRHLLCPCRRFENPATNGCNEYHSCIIFKMSWIDCNL